jgi:hypothetical protein
MWSRPAAEGTTSAKTVTRIELAGAAYSVPADRGRSDGRMSEHASANAVDIGGFTLADGTSIGRAAGWRGTPSRSAPSCAPCATGPASISQAVLSPDYNRAHRDHLHSIWPIR